MPIAYPYKMSDWYGYDRDCSPNTSFSCAVGQTTESGACAATINQTYYHNGASPLPAVGDECYDDLSGTTVLVANYYKTSTSGGFRITGTVGTVASTFNCMTGYSSSVMIDTVANACAASLSPTYYHDGAGLTPVVNDTCYTTSAGTTTIVAGYYNIGSGLYIRVYSTGVVGLRDTCPTLTMYSSSVGGKPSAICTASITELYYHDGVGTYPTTGDTCYTTSAGTTVLSNATRKLSTGLGAISYTISGGSGVISSIALC